MLLRSLRQSTATARWVLVWFVLSMGVALAAPAWQPVALASVCSSVAPIASGAGSDAPPLEAHDGWQCIQCLHLGAPAPEAVRAVGAQQAPEGPRWHAALRTHPSPQSSPAGARAPPQA